MGRTHENDEVIKAIDGEAGQGSRFEEPRGELERVESVAAMCIGASLLKDDAYRHWCDTAALRSGCAPHEVQRGAPTTHLLGSTVLITTP